MLHKDKDRKGSVARNISGRDSQVDWGQVVLIGGKPPVVKVTLTLTVTLGKTIQSQNYFTIGGLQPISSSWRQDP
jgi:hypothetical protein